MIIQIPIFFRSHTVGSSSASNEEGEPSSIDAFFGYLTLILLGALVILAMYVLAWSIDNTWYNGRLHHHLFIKSDCDFVVPDEYEIMFDGKMYAVRIKETDEYLCDGVTDIEDWTQDISPPTLFYNECKAKGYLKKYIGQGFKPISK